MRTKGMQSDLLIFSSDDPTIRVVEKLNRYITNNIKAFINGENSLQEKYKTLREREKTLREKKEVNYGY